MLSGNEAIARGAWEAGVQFAAGYPGTPSTEILEKLGRMDGVAAQWSINEKVALESVVGASLAGARALCSMKHVGLNVAADPLMTLGLTGVNGGIVIVSADDPGMASSQNEQDNRNLARFAGVIMLEPADSQECLDLARRAFDLSEAHDLPVVLRTTTPINHGKGIVRRGTRHDVPLREVPRDPAKWVMLPGWGQARRRQQLERIDALAARGHELGLHRLERSGASESLGVLASGACVAYVREALPDVPLLALQLTHPLPWGAVDELAATVRRVLVVEELDGYLEEALRAHGVDAVGKAYLSRCGALGAAAVRSAFARARGDIAGAPAPVPRPPTAWPVSPQPVAAAGPTAEQLLPRERLTLCTEAPGRPPVLCPACPYRGVLRAFRREGAFVFGDIGCSTLGALVPHETIHFTLCMGASIGAASGYSRIRGEKGLALIGDSTFLHSGMTALADAVYNAASVTVVILDNDAIAMTGGQGHPGTGATLAGPPGAARIDYEALVRALGVKRISVVDPYDGDLFQRTLSREMRMPESSVIVARRPCILVDRGRASQPAFVNPSMCTGCRDCLAEGCPALVLYQNVRSEDRVRIDSQLCVGCPDCSQVCAPGAISWFPEEPVRSLT